MKIILSSNPYRDRSMRAAQEAKQILEREGAEVSICLPFTPRRGERIDVPQGITQKELTQELPDTDVLVCFGGDGTILHAARDATKFDVPILGANMGSVGFMAELERGELSKLADLVTKPLRVEERMMLKICHYRGSRLLLEDYALNDAVFSKGSTARVAEVEVWADQTLVNHMTGDGVIVASPTGSTAYSMSAGGPIVEPTSSALIVTPVCAHQLGARPMVLDAQRTVTIRLPRNSRKTLSLAVDGGRSIRIMAGERVEVFKADHTTKLVRLTNRNFYQIVNQKLGGFGR